MGIASRNSMTSQKRGSEAREPDYKNRHNDITAAVWEEKTPKGPRYTLRLQREYVDNRGKTQFTDSFRECDIDDISKLLAKVQEDIVDTMRESGMSEESIQSAING